MRLNVEWRKEGRVQLVPLLNSMEVFWDTFSFFDGQIANLVTLRSPVADNGNSS